MVTLAGQYYCAPLKGYLRVTQGDPLSSTISNMVVDAVIRHWVAVVVGEEAEPKGFGRSFQRISALLCVNSGIIASLHSSRIQEALGVITGLF